MLNDKFSSAEMVEITRGGSVVRRYHCYDVLANENIGKHCYGTINLAFILCKGEPSVNLIKYLCYHDTIEQFQGDMPSPFKNIDKNLQNEIKRIENKINKKFGFDIKLTNKEKVIAKTCDVLDGIYYSIEEVRRGNKNFGAVLMRWMGIFSKIPYKNHIDKKIILSIKNDIFKIVMDFRLTDIEKRDCWRHFKKAMLSNG